MNGWKEGEAGGILTRSFILLEIERIKMREHALTVVSFWVLTCWPSLNRFHSSKRPFCSHTFHTFYWFFADSLFCDRSSFIGFLFCGGSPSPNTMASCYLRCIGSTTTIVFKFFSNDWKCLVWWYVIRNVSCIRVSVYLFVCVWTMYLFVVITRIIPSST